MLDADMAAESAREALDVLSTPIKGVPSIEVIHRGNALRLLAAAFLTVYSIGRDSVTKEAEAGKVAESGNRV